VRGVKFRTEGTSSNYNLLVVKLVTAKRFSRVLGMLSSLGVKVLCPT